MGEVNIRRKSVFLFCHALENVWPSVVHTSETWFCYVKHYFFFSFFFGNVTVQKPLPSLSLFLCTSSILALLITQAIAIQELERGAGPSPGGRRVSSASARPAPPVS